MPPETNINSTQDPTNQPTQPPAVVAPEVDPINSATGVRIDNVNTSVWQYVKKHKWKQILLLAPLAVLWEILVIFILIKTYSLTNNTGNAQGYIYLLALPVIIFFLWIYRLRKKFEADFLGEFAQANNYAFDKNGIVNEAYGSIFRLEGRQSVSDVVTGSYENTTLRLFIYEDVIGYGRSQRYDDTVIELDLHGKLPNLLMSNRSSRFERFSVAKAFGIKNTIKLEGDFNNYFILYAPVGNEVEALEVFTPDIMSLMEDESRHYTVELAGSKIYIYCNGFINTTEILTQVFTLAKKLVDKLAPVANRLQNDSAIVVPPVNVTNNRKSSFLSKVLIIILLVTLLLLGIIIGTIALVNSNNQTSVNTNSGDNKSSPSAPAASIITIDNSFPYCGAMPNSATPITTKQYLNATIALNKARQSISNQIIAANYTASNSVIHDQIMADQNFLNSFQALNFPQNIASDSLTLQAAIGTYDSYLLEEESGTTVSSSTLSNARTARVNASNKLREDLGLPQSTCSFYEP